MISSPLELSNDSYKLSFWEPEPKQVEFIQIPYEVFEAFYGGALGGGKSEILVMLPILYRLHEHPRFHGMFFRRTKSQHDETLFARARYLYGKVGGVPNENKMLFTFPSGAVIRFTYLERDSHARDHDGAEYHYVAFDELTHFSRFQYTYITTRIRRSTCELPTIIRCASNPSNIGHAWVRKRFIEPYKKGGKLLKDSQTNTLRIFIPSKLTDNKHITENDPEYANRLQILKDVDEAEYRAKVEGDWWAYSGQVFTEFRDERQPNEPDNALHVISPFKIPYYWPRIAAIDWGWSANNWIGLAAISPEKRFYIYNEYVVNRTTISKWTKEARKMMLPDIDSLKAIFIDPSARRHEASTEKPIIEQIAEGLGEGLKDKVELADNDRLAGKLAFHEALRWKPLPNIKEINGKLNEELFQKIYRNWGAKAANDYRQSFEPEKSEENIPRLQIFSNCEEIIKVIPLCVYNENKSAGRSRKRYEDVAEFDGDDAYDGGRYLLNGIDRYVEEVITKSEEFQKRDAIENHLILTNDQTSYYRRMEMLEAESKNRGKSIKRTGRVLRRTA